MRPFNPSWRAAPRAAFDVDQTATGQGTVDWTIDGQTRRVYRNVNLSIYSAQVCNARCPFCVEELRPLSRGLTLAEQRRVEADDSVYFQRLEETLDLTRSLDPSVSITGGEPSKDPRLPRIVETLALAGSRKRTMTTNASGLLDPRPGGDDVLELVLRAGLDHLNISRAHWDEAVNQRIMRIAPAQTNADLHTIVTRAAEAGARPRLSCVLLRDRVAALPEALRYLDWAAALGVDNVVFRQLMQYDAATHQPNPITRFSDAHRAPLAPLLEAIRPSDLSAAGHPAFTFQRQVLGYYYYVEVYRYVGPFGAVDVCLEAADLRAIEVEKAQGEAIVHELIFHPDATLCSSWQPWDGRIR